MLSLLLVAMMLLPVVPMVGAADIVASGTCGINAEWTLDSNGTMVISGNGDIDIYMIDMSDYYKNQVRTVIINEGIMQIHEYTFADYENLTSVTLPESLIWIGSCAFMACPIKTLRLPANLKSVRGAIALHADFEGYIVDEDHAWLTVDENGDLYNKDKTTLIHHIMNPVEKEFTIPDSVTTIGKYAFAYNVFLEKINIPETVKVIDEYAFLLCAMLEELSLPRKLETMGCVTDSGIFVRKLTLPENAAIACSDGGWEGEDGSIITHNHFELPSSITELTLYDRDMDLTDMMYPGFCEDPFKNAESFELFLSRVRLANAKYFVYWFGYGEEPDEDDYVDADDEIYYNTEAEPDLVINETELYKIPGFVIRCYKGSTAEAYAKQYGFTIKYICDEHIEQTVCGYAADCENEGLTDGVNCVECGETLVAQQVIPAKGHSHNAVVTAPTCIAKGYTTYTCSCGDTYKSDYVAKADHVDMNGDNCCELCGADLQPEDNTPSCSHICHKDGILGIFWKIMQFFWKLFGMNPVCECGKAHY